MKKQFLLFILFIFIAFACGTDKNKEVLEGLFIKEIPPIVNTVRVTNVGISSANVSAAIPTRGSSRSLKLGICFHTQPNPTISNSVVQGTGVGANFDINEFTVTLNGLQPNTTYYARAYATTEKNVTIYGLALSFNTLQPLSVTTGQSFNITSRAAQVLGSINNLSAGIAIIEHGHCYNNSPNPDINGQRTNLGSANTNRDFTSNLTNLNPTTLYYARAYARLNTGEVFYGGNTSFTTLADRPPVVQINNITDVTRSSATASSAITDAGTLPITSYGVCFSTNNPPTITDIRVNTTSNITQAQSFNNSLIGLNANTTYYVRAYAVTSEGTYYSSTLGFRTPDITVVNPTSRVVTQNLIAYYDFNNGQATDVVNGQNGIFRSGAGTNTNTPDNSTSSANIPATGYIEVVSSILGTPLNISYCAWVRTTNQTFTLLTLSQSTGASNFAFSFFHIANGLFGDTGSFPFALGRISMASSLLDGNWHHIAISAAYRSFPNNDDYRIYVDGRVVETINSNRNNPPAILRFFIGQNINGQLDNVRLYNRVITDAEVQQIFNAKQ